ncbi:DNA repair protein RecN [Dysgonomonas massiliensis]|uniref:DNA repair protein RecN n=1 Tax=Dysgonomonas massiliensis TaxID=2040292 RepID=UPI000C78DF0E|nr:DNA repair protein RecN [Dysgonomonas massiliensis]
MLKSLYIKNYALIDSLEIDFDNGFSVITGETGAGKSIILGALGLILGQRADAKAIKKDENKCIIEGEFDIAEYNLNEFFTERDIEFDKNCILRREILATGKSRAFINDTPTTLTDLKELGSRLIDIHSQHQNLLLGDSRFQMQIVDTLAGNKTLLKDYQESFKDYKSALKALEELKEIVRLNKEEEDYLRFQYNSLTEAGLKEDEQEELESELEELNHAEDIKSGLYKIHTLLSDDDQGIIPRLKESLSTSQSLSSFFQRSDEFTERIQTAYIDLKDLGSEVERMAEDVEFNPERLNFIEARLDTIYTLQKKYNTSNISGLLALQSELAKKLENIESSDEDILLLEKEVSLKAETMLKLAQKLSKNRQSITNKFEKELIQSAAYLGMPNIQFKCSFEKESQPNNFGIDKLTFMFSANKNASLQPIAEIASGGEISRIMLCLKSMLAGAMALPTIIFDEIDTGVSGEIADKMGIIMQSMGKNMQVLAITHLPQIAAKGSAHYWVYKLDNETSTTTNLRRLTDQERLEEIARMLSGSVLTDAAIENAKVMLNHH